MSGMIVNSKTGAKLYFYKEIFNCLNLSAELNVQKFPTNMEDLTADT